MPCNIELMTFLYHGQLTKHIYYTSCHFSAFPYSAFTLRCDKKLQPCMNTDVKRPSTNDWCLWGSGPQRPKPTFASRVLFGSTKIDPRSAHRLKCPRESRSPSPFGRLQKHMYISNTHTTHHECRVYICKMRWVT